MPKSLAKVHKQISKKTKGNISSLHENSRNSQRLRRAGARDDKIARVSKARAKANQPHSLYWPYLRFRVNAHHCLVRRVAFFQGAAKAAEGPINTEMMQVLIHR